jgi:hypothetical protein
MAVLGQIHQIASRADMNAILAAPNVPGGAPFLKQAAQKIKNELNIAVGGRRRRTAARCRTMRRRKTHHRRR